MFHPTNSSVNYPLKERWQIRTGNEVSSIVWWYWFSCSRCSSMHNYPYILSVWDCAQMVLLLSRGLQNKFVSSCKSHRNLSCMPKYLCQKWLAKTWCNLVIQSYSYGRNLFSSPSCILLIQKYYLFRLTFLASARRGQHTSKKFRLLYSWRIVCEGRLTKMHL